MDDDGSVFFMGQSYSVFCENRCLNIYNKQSDCSNPKIELLQVDRALSLVVNDWLQGKIAHDIHVVFGYDPAHLLKLIIDNVDMRHAAGGVVFGADNEVLMIVRNKYNDFPKGHIDAGETAKQAALRETIEETGIINPEIVEWLSNTWHCYSENGRAVLKQTQWFAMKADLNQPFNPQQSEGITAVFTVKKSELNAALNKCFRSLKETLKPLILSVVEGGERDQSTFP